MNWLAISVFVKFHPQTILLHLKLRNTFNLKNKKRTEGTYSDSKQNVPLMPLLELAQGIKQ